MFTHLGCEEICQTYIYLYTSTNRARFGRLRIEHWTGHCPTDGHGWSARTVPLGFLPYRTPPTATRQCSCIMIFKKRTEKHTQTSSPRLTFCVTRCGSSFIPLDFKFLAYTLLILVKLNRNKRFFVIPEEAIGSEIGVCGCHGPPGVGGLPHYREHPSRACCSESVKILLRKCDLKKDLYYLDECIDIFPLGSRSPKLIGSILKVWPKHDRNV